MTMNLFVFEEATGRIESRQSKGSRELIERYGEIGQHARVFDKCPPDGLTGLYVESDCLKSRPKLNLRLSARQIRANGSDVAKLYGVPRGASVTVANGFEDAVAHVADGSTIQIVAATPAHYRIIVQNFPHCDEVLEFQAV